MAAIIIDGKALAATINEETAAEVAQLYAATGRSPGLAVVLVGEDSASQIYVRNKRRTCQKLGIESFPNNLPAQTTQPQVLDLVASLNQNPDVHGILVQSPLPDHIDENAVIEALDPDKDVDGFHPVNVGRSLNGKEAFVPCTPKGIQEMLRRYDIETQGAHAVIVGRSNIVGKPMAALLMQKGPDANATVTVCHSRTRDLPAVTRQADILIAAIGRPRFVTADMVRDGATVIDVGINRTDDGLVGDVDFDAVKDKATAITPVPGGVGPMTIAMLMKNTIRAAQRQLEAG